MGVSIVSEAQWLYAGALFIWLYVSFCEAEAEAICNMWIHPNRA